jgi:predicted nucleic acid-binding protein
VIVVDASALIEVLRQSADAWAIESRMFAPGETLHAPHVLDLEIAQVVRRYVHRRDMSTSRAVEALADLHGFRITRYEHEVFLPRIWQLRDRLTAYDAVYLALAEALGATLLTRDHAFLDVTGTDVPVEVL